MITSMFLVFVLWDPTNANIMHTGSMKIGMYETRAECEQRAARNNMIINTADNAWAQLTAMCIAETEVQ